MGRACSTHRGKLEIHTYNIVVSIPVGKKPLGRLRSRRKAILELILKKWSMRVWTWSTSF
jgi:hypothetical protein